MTREEAARIINECKDKGFKHTFYTLNEYHAALDMAIKALEQEPCEDAVSREKNISKGFENFMIKVLRKQKRAESEGSDADSD